MTLHPLDNDWYSRKPPVEPAVPDHDVGRKEVDSFILKALEANHLQPSEHAPLRVLISRPTFDLSRLPSKPQDIRAFHGNYASNPDKAY